MKTKVIIAVTNDLVADNRVHKVATTLHNNGFDVLLVGRRLKNSLPVKRLYQTKRFRLIFTKSALFYAEFNIRLLFFLLFTKSDIFLSNDLDTLLAVYVAAKLKKKPVVFDSHEIFPEVPELVARPKIKRFWEKLEAFLLPKIRYLYTVCQSIADFYEKKYGTKFKVVRNVPFYYESENIQRKNPPVIIYQGAANIGRGLDLAIKAMQYIDNAKLLIVGGGDVLNELKDLTKKLNLSEKVEFTGKLPFDQVKKYTQTATLGLSIEENLGLNYYFALPNKIFDYIQAEVPVLCSDFPEMQNIIKKYQIGYLLKSRKAEEFAQQINEILKQLSQDSTIRKNLKIAKKELCWENEEKIILNIFSEIGKNN